MKEWLVVDNPMYSPFDGSSDKTYICPYCGSQQEKRTQFCPDCGHRCAFVSIEKPPSD